MSLPGQRTFGSDLPHLHFWVRLPARSTCKWCLYKLQRDRLQGLVPKSTARVRAKTTVVGFAMLESVRRGHVGETFIRIMLIRHNS